MRLGLIASLMTGIMLSLACTASASSKRMFLEPSRTIVIAGPITDRLYEPVMKALGDVSKDHDIVDIIISSPGGSVVVGSLWIDYMHQLQANGIRFRCFVRDIAASMAFQLLLHCDERYATPHSFLLWHPVRIFMQGALTSEASAILATQLKAADDVALHDLRAYLKMQDEVLLYHFRNETLHQALGLMKLAPDFFDGVTNNVENLRPEKAALDTTGLGGFFGVNQIIYIHERFIQEGNVQ